MNALEKSFAYEHVSTEVEKLQVQIAELIVENERISNQLTNTTFDTNDVISYLKKTVEEKDEEIARLEEILSQQTTERNSVLRAERSRHEEKEKEWKKEKEDMNNEMKIMNTQLGNEQRLERDIEEMRTNLDEVEKKLKAQSEQLEEKEVNERELKIAALEQAKSELESAFQKEADNVRNEFELRKTAELKMNEKMIEHLQNEIKSRDGEIARLDEMRRQAENLNEDVNKEKNNLEEELHRIRLLLEKSTKQAEKAVKDTKRRLEESERRRTKITTEYNETVQSLRKEVAELQESLVNATTRCDRMEKLLTFEKNQREATVAAHASQNQKVTELRKFLELALTGKENVDEVIGESRHAIFAQLSLIVSQIPIVR